jgi:hypothetical protein
MHGSLALALDGGSTGAHAEFGPITTFRKRKDEQDHVSNSTITKIKGNLK